MTDGDQASLFESNSDETLTLGLYAEQAYLDYAVSVVRGRALPDLGDGQKPVQRRILYAMQAMGLATGARPVKSARVVGDVLGKYHPHSDQAAYDAMVRMAQSFTLRYPLIDGQGNFGSRDGDNAAAMRYTEARLTPFARLLLDEINEGTVDFVPNYDGSQKEPTTLPARLPVMLLNGASGIAVGMATEIVSHNLVEVAQACVALIKDPALSTEDLLTYIPGPDFPGGAHVINTPQEIAQVYKSGRGTLKVRARWTFEEFARGQWQLVIHELPPGTSGQKVLEEIEDLTNPKMRAGRKTLTPEQQQTRSQILTLLDAVRDESGKDAAVRLVFEPKTSRIDRDELITTLLAQTSLETNVSANLVCVGIDGLPRQMPLLEILTQWLSFRSQTLLRRSQHRLEQVLDRLHVLQGRLLVYLNVDEVVQLIRESDEPRQALMEKFDLSHRQAEDILEMRLRQLARLEGIRIEKELADREKEATRLQELVDKPAALRRLMIREIEADTKLYGDDRRTLIEPAQRAVIEVKVVDEPLTVIVSQLGWVRTRQGYGHERSQFTFKSGDECYDTFECRTTSHLIAIGSNGRVYTVPIAGLPSGRSDGSPVTAMVDLEPGTHLVHFIAADESSNWLLSNSAGLGFEVSLKTMSSRQRSGKQFVTLEPGEALLKPLLLPDSASHVALLASDERLAIVPRNEIRKLSAGGRGTVMMTLDEGVSLVQLAATDGQTLSVQGIYRKRERIDTLSGEALAIYITKRARKGRIFDIRLKSPTLLSLQSP